MNHTAPGIIQQDGPTQAVQYETRKPSTKYQSRRPCDAVDSLQRHLPREQLGREPAVSCARTSCASCGCRGACRGRRARLGAVRGLARQGLPLAAGRWPWPSGVPDLQRCSGRQLRAEASGSGRAARLHRKLAPGAHPGAGAEGQVGVRVPLAQALGLGARQEPAPEALGAWTGLSRLLATRQLLVCWCVRRTARSAPQKGLATVRLARAEARLGGRGRSSQNPCRKASYYFPLLSTTAHYSPLQPSTALYSPGGFSRSRSSRSTSPAAAAAGAPLGPAAAALGEAADERWRLLGPRLTPAGSL
jgi:hypothetical protein